MAGLYYFYKHKHLLIKHINIQTWILLNIWKGMLYQTFCFENRGIFVEYNIFYFVSLYFFTEFQFQRFEVFFCILKKKQGNKMLYTVKNVIEFQLWLNCTAIVYNHVYKCISTCTYRFKNNIYIFKKISSYFYMVGVKVHNFIISYAIFQQ